MPCISDAYFLRGSLLKKTSILVWNLLRIIFSTLGAEVCQASKVFFNAKRVFVDDTRIIKIYAMAILVPRAHDPSGLWQESRALALSNTGSPQFTDFMSNLTNLIG